MSTTENMITVGGGVLCCRTGELRFLHIDNEDARRAWILQEAWLNTETGIEWRDVPTVKASEIAHEQSGEKP